MKTFRALSALLQYPEPELIEAIDEIEAALDEEGMAPRVDLDALQWLIGELRCGDIYDLQADWVMHFDRTRALSLHLFEHVHGESRDRGQALVDLQSIYEARGLAVETRELPDYLPLFLEYLSLLPLDEARAMLGETAHVLAALAERLGKRRSAYEALFRTLLSIAAANPDAEALDALRDEPAPAPDDLEALDAAWEEEAVTFGPGQSGCRDDLAAKIRQGRRPAPGVEEQIRAARANMA
ncbi:MAG: nitrate reductase molybdenum cofactor assembly chaperone [Hyphomicrobiales bacterium]|nr:nitrate reductase molybdenum cofactor assembly chaperone [Hyphomicrobiales bacterium]